MKLTSMKLPPREKTAEEKMYPTMCGPADEPEYPYGLCISLDETQLDALGIKNLPKISAAVTIHATGDVTGVNENETQSGSHRSVSIQITALSVE